MLRQMLAMLVSMAAISTTSVPADPAAVLVDRFGRTIGPVIAPGFVGMVIDGQAVRLAFTGLDGFPMDPIRPVYFESGDCSGDPLIEVDPMPPIAYVGPTKEPPGFGYLAPGPDRRWLTSGSTWLVGKNASSTCSPMARATIVAPIKESAAIPGFAAPFYVQLR